MENHEANNLRFRTRNSENNLEKDKKYAEKLSKEKHTKSAPFETVNFLPNICINDKISPKRCTVPNECVKSKVQGTAFKLPCIDAQFEGLLKRERANSAIIEQKENIKNSDNSEYDIHYVTIGRQKRSLEKSLKESLKAYDEPRCYLEGENKSTRHLMLEVNEFYLDMAEQLRLLKGNLLSTARKSTDEIDEKSSTSSYEMEVNKLISSIEEDDGKVAENVKRLQNMKQERNLIRQEIKSLYGEHETDDKSDDQVYNVESAGIIKGENNVVTFARESNENIRKNVQCDGKDFVAKNRELAKEYNMSRYCLTDEEKRKLQSLLSDIDVAEEKNVEECVEEVKKHNEEVCGMENVKIAQPSKETFHEEDENDNEDDQAYNDMMNVNGFKFEANETEILNNLDVRLLNLQEEEPTQNEINVKIDDYDDLKKAESIGKHWKFDLLQKRLKHIEKDLATIRAEKEKENEEKDNSLNEAIENTVNIGDEYERSINDISVDIGEIEYDVGKETEEELNQCC